MFLDNGQVGWFSVGRLVGFGFAFGLVLVCRLVDCLVGLIGRLVGLAGWFLGLKLLIIYLVWLVDWLTILIGYIFCVPT